MEGKLKQLVLVAVLASLASTALTLLAVHALHTRTHPGPPPAGPSNGNAELADVVRELAAFRREVGEALRADPHRGQPATAPGSGSHPPGGSEAAPPVDSRGPAPLEGVPIPTRQSRLRETLIPETTNVAKSSRARWILRSEREVHEWFGPPDRIGVDDKGVEDWLYRLQDASGGEDSEWVTFEVHGGRVISFR
jgi:hypothetical protein